MSYILLLANSMLGERINRGEHYTSYKIISGVGVLLKLTKGGNTIIPFHQIRRIDDLVDARGDV